MKLKSIISVSCTDFVAPPLYLTTFPSWWWFLTATWYRDNMKLVSLLSAFPLVPLLARFKPYWPYLGHVAALSKFPSATPNKYKIVIGSSMIPHRLHDMSSSCHYLGKRRSYLKLGSCLVFLFLFFGTSVYNIVKRITYWKEFLNFIFA